MSERSRTGHHPDTDPGPVPESLIRRGADGDTERLFGRPEIQPTLPGLRRGEHRVAITGGHGYLGTQLGKFIDDHYDVRTTSIDLDPYDPHQPVDPQAAGVMNLEQLADDLAGATHVVHLAAHKHATHGEKIPDEVAALNIQGTANVARLCMLRGLPLVVASTCKASSPVTAYGASKLIAERIAVNAGGRALRLVNVAGSTGSVLEAWDAIPRDLPVAVTRCARFWITPREATRLLLGALRLPAGVYAPAGVQLQEMRDIAERLGRTYMWGELRRGDRPQEQLVGRWETPQLVDEDPAYLRILQAWERE